MLLFWSITCLDSRDRQSKTRLRTLITDQLDPAVKAAVELSVAIGNPLNFRGMLPFRHLFRDCLDHEMEAAWSAYHGKVKLFSIRDYFEDENGQELGNSGVAAALTGNADAMMFPANLPAHYMNYALAQPSQVSLDQIKLSQDSLEMFSIFRRDLRELVESAFYNHSDMSFTIGGGGSPELSTQATDDEIRSFITIFRRLYMKSEPAHFLKAAELLKDIVPDHPLTKLVSGIAGEYVSELAKQPNFFLFTGPSIPRGKRLIDVFLYTQYAHQPDDRRLRQYNECLRAVNGNKSLLACVFLNVLRGCSLHMRNGGKIIVDFFDQYCHHYGLSIEPPSSMGIDNPGIGRLEKGHEREDRLRSEKAEELANALWEKAGCPTGGHTLFLNEARTQLAAAMGQGAKRPGASDPSF
jgi:hypothetical protein